MSAQNRVNNNRKRKSTKSTKSKRKVEFEKGKVYIPAYKAIMLCVGIITICMALLLITTVPSPKEEPKLQLKRKQK